MSDSLRPHGLQYARLPCRSLTLRVYWNSCPSSQWSHPAISSSVIPFFSNLQSFPASGSFQWFSSLHRVAKVLEFQLQHQSFHEHSGLISFRIDWLALLAVQGTLKSLLQYHSLKGSILWCSASFTVQLSIHTWLLRLFLLAILIPACASSSPAFCMMYSAYKLNRQGDNIQPWVLLSQFGTSLLFHVQF